LFIAAGIPIGITFLAIPSLTEKRAGLQDKIEFPFIK